MPKGLRVPPKERNPLRVPQEERKRLALPVLRAASRILRREKQSSILDALTTVAGNSIVREYAREAVRRGGLPVGCAGLFAFEESGIDYRDRRLALAKALEWCGAPKHRGGWKVTGGSEKTRVRP